jgi:Uma2 family endonuclease
MGMAVPIYWTADMVRALPDDGKQYETVYGELLVSPAPRAWHEEIVGRLYEHVRAYVRSEQLELHVFGSRSDISWGDDTLVQPDVFVVPLAEARTLRWSAMTSLLLAVEVLSPSSVRADRFTKRRLYQEVGIPRYWIVDADADQVEVWTPEVRFPTVERERLVWAPDRARETCEVPLGDLFRPL